MTGDLKREKLMASRATFLRGKAKDKVTFMVAEMS